MSESEEERRRRCIIDPNSCAAGMTQRSALAEELRHGVGLGARSARRAAAYLLEHFRLEPKLSEEERVRAALDEVAPPGEI